MLETFPTEGVCRFHELRVCLQKAQIKGLFVLSILLISSAAFAESCTLQTYASSWMATGTPFSVECPSGIYSGILITTPARRFFRRGHMMLRFDQPVTLYSKITADEGKLQPGRGKQIASMIMAGGVGIGAKDLTEPIQPESIVDDHDSDGRPLSTVSFRPSRIPRRKTSRLNGKSNGAKQCFHKHQR